MGADGGTYVAMGDGEWRVVAGWGDTYYLSSRPPLHEMRALYVQLSLCVHIVPI